MTSSQSGEALQSELEKVTRQRDAWMAACRYMHDCLFKKSAAGTPADNLSVGDFGRILAMVGRAEHLSATGPVEEVMTAARRPTLSVVQKNLLKVPGYVPYCGGNCREMPRTTWKPDVGQFQCRCGWQSSFSAEFIQKYRKFRIDSQVCSKCGVTVGANKQKYCGDGNDKDNPHQWTEPGPVPHE